MTNYTNEIEAANRCITQYTRMALGKEAVAEALLEGAALDRERAEYWSGELTRFMGLAGITNVIPLPPVGETIA